MSGRFIVGVDVGGTFTDILCLDTKTQVLLSAKVPSMPGSQWRGVLSALDELGIDTAAIRAFVHGTTIATNALLERKGARTALVTTEGFRDVYEIGRVNRPDAYNLFFKKHIPLVERALRFATRWKLGERDGSSAGFSISSSPGPSRWSGAI